MDDLFEDLEDAFDEDEPVLRADAEEEAGEESETQQGDDELEAEARRQASQQADALLREHHDQSDEPPLGPRTEAEMGQWTEYLETVLGEAAAERERVQAVFDAEAEASGGQGLDLHDAVDFTTWDTESFSELMDRVSGKVPVSAPRRPVADDVFDRALSLMEG
jgi:hypothetical protein